MSAIGDYYIHTQYSWYNRTKKNATPEQYHEPNLKNFDNGRAALSKAKQKMNYKQQNKSMNDVAKKLEKAYNIILKFIFGFQLATDEIIDENKLKEEEAGLKQKVIDKFEEVSNTIYYNKKYKQIKKGYFAIETTEDDKGNLPYKKIRKNIEKIINFYKNSYEKLLNNDEIIKRNKKASDFLKVLTPFVNSTIVANYNENTKIKDIANEIEELYKNLEDVSYNDAAKMAGFGFEAAIDVINESLPEFAKIFAIDNIFPEEQNIDFSTGQKTQTIGYIPNFNLITGKVRKKNKKTGEEIMVDVSSIKDFISLYKEEASKLGVSIDFQVEYKSNIKSYQKADNLLQIKTILEDGKVINETVTLSTKNTGMKKFDTTTFTYQDYDNKGTISLVSNTPFLYLIQEFNDETSNYFADHYFNLILLSSQSSILSKKINQNNSETINNLKIILGIQAAIGATLNKELTQRVGVDFLVINNRNYSKEKGNDTFLVKVISKQELLNSIFINNTQALSLSPEKPLREVSELYNQFINKKEVPTSDERRDFALSAAYYTKIRVSIKKRILLNYYKNIIS